MPTKQIEHFRPALQNGRYAGKEQRAQTERQDGLGGVGDGVRLRHGEPVELWDDESHAFQLARTLMVPVTLFQVDGEFGVMPSDELDDADVVVVHEYDPYPFGPAH